MADNRSAKRAALRTAVIDAAAARISAGGLQSLRARDVMNDVGSALGGLYNAFDDLDDLILHVNLGTLKRMRRLVEERLTDAAEPRAALQSMAGAYLFFARENHALWLALFEHRLSPEKSLPDWYKAEQAALIQMLAAALKRLAPELDGGALLVRARTIFGAVHGIVAIALENRFVGVPSTDLEQELAQFLNIVVSGMEPP